MQGPTHITIQLFVVPNLSSSLAVSLSRWSEGFRDRAIYLQKSAATLLYCGRLHGSSITFFCSEGLNWSRLGLHLHLLWLEGSLSSYTFIWVRCNERLFLLLSSLFEATSLAAAVLTAVGPLTLWLHWLLKVFWSHSALWSSHSGAR
jgi:hypothetical protein